MIGGKVAMQAIRFQPVVLFFTIRVEIVCPCERNASEN